MSTTVRNCTRDEGGPFEAGSQVLVSSHRKLLSSKAMVVSVAETPGQEQEFSQVMNTILDMIEEGLDELPPGHTIADRYAVGIEVIKQWPEVLAATRAQGDSDTTDEGA